MDSNFPYTNNCDGVEPLGIVDYSVGLIGMWIVSDAILSYTLYINAPSYDGSARQTWARDHWVRLVRAICGVVLIWMGTL